MSILTLPLQLLMVGASLACITVLIHGTWTEIIRPQSNARAFYDWESEGDYEYVPSNRRV